ncbi:IS630 family transposase [Rickettsia endosymbiont of Gonocerus acuteangulatus]|uniref:IS630 family transposase n=1 Tax=Rickettsia endosymbiont of Gonocerus acuteangulatus TaxID=3066266 RepID=UPI003132DF6A
MAKAYSYDLRIRVIKSLTDGKTIKETSEIYSISRKTIIEWKKLKKQTGDVKAKSGYHTGHRRIIRDIEGFKKFIELNFDKTTMELANNWSQKVSASTISRLLNKLGYSYKKTFLHPKRDIGLRNEFILKLKTIDKQDLVFIDESGIEDNSCREHGWSIIGQRCYGEKVYQHKSRISMIAGLCVKDIIAPIIFDGTCNKDIFETYVQEILIKELKAGQIVVMDNINFHKSTKVKTLIESVGCSILFLPTYSPDLNPIEHYWFKIKNEIRKTISNFEHFFDAVYYALKKVITLSH